jgi:hypothetical protein
MVDWKMLVAREVQWQKEARGLNTRQPGRVFFI